MKDKFRKFISKIVSDVLDSKLKEIQNHLDKIEKHYWDLPTGACWMCGGGIKRHEGSIVWRGRLFHPKNCFEKYRALMTQDQKENNYLVDGDPVHINQPIN